jgi:hypothetical protein
VKPEHLELLVPRDRVAALRALCGRGEWQRARRECLRIALARGGEARQRVKEEHGGEPVPVRSIVNTALEMAAWRALARYCRELGGAS